jgi:solute carrier family 25 protein 38
MASTTTNTTTTNLPRKSSADVEEEEVIIEEKKQLHNINAFLRGCISGVFVVAILQPFDVVKTVQQAAGTRPQDAVKIIIKEDGIKGLWLRGLAPTLVRGALGPGTYFQALEFTEKWFKEKGKLADFTQGALARGIGAVVISPFSVLKARIEWNPKSGFKFAGARDMFVGLLPTLARDVPFSGLYMVFYRGFKWMEKPDDSSVRRFGIDFSAGLVAGLLATAITHPFDVIKTRSQIGIPLFGGNVWSGLSLRLAKRPLSMALTWACYEIISRKSSISNNSSAVTVTSYKSS